MDKKTRMRIDVSKLKGIREGYSNKDVKEGDTVILRDAGRFGISDHNPEWGVGGEYVFGVLTDLGYETCRVNWENGRAAIYSFGDCDLAIFNPGVLKPEPPKELDPTKLDSLVIAQENKDEIVAVLKQHKHAKQLFEDWGLGEVLEYGKGMTFLFYGPPGTGKTWAASCMAKAMGVEILSIGAAEIQTQEPGGACRNIKDAFKNATEQNKLLFLDECDSLITNRQDVGMILGSEINTLLSEIEKYEGVLVLATNRIETLDPALERRISLMVEFPEPNYENRLGIWQKLLPSKMPLGKDVKVEDLATYALTGGQIKNVILQAARLAVAAEEKKVALSHFEAAIKRLNQSKSLMGTASRYIQVVQKADGMSVGVQTGVTKKPVMVKDMAMVGDLQKSNKGK